MARNGNINRPARTPVRSLEWTLARSFAFQGEAATAPFAMSAGSLGRGTAHWTCSGTGHGRVVDAATPPLSHHAHATTPPLLRYHTPITPSFPHLFFIDLPRRLPFQRATRTASPGTQAAKARVVVVVRQPRHRSRRHSRRRKLTQSNPRTRPQPHQRGVSLERLEARIVGRSLHLPLLGVKDKTRIPHQRGLPAASDGLTFRITQVPNYQRGAEYLPDIIVTGPESRGNPALRSPDALALSGVCQWF